MGKLLCLMCVLVTLLGASNSTRQSANPPVASPPQSEDCGIVIFDLTECVSFLVEGSGESKPEASCCVGYESVVSASDDCICVAIQQSAGLGIALNLTKLITLPTACGMSLFPINKCHINAIAPAPGPVRLVPPKIKTPAPAPSIITEEAPAPAPAPAPALSAAHSISASFEVLVISMLAAGSLCL